MTGLGRPRHVAREGKSVLLKVVVAHQQRFMSSRVEGQIARR